MTGKEFIDLVSQLKKQRADDAGMRDWHREESMDATKTEELRKYHDTQAAIFGVKVSEWDASIRALEESLISLR